MRYRSITLAVVSSCLTTLALAQPLSLSHSTLPADYKRASEQTPMVAPSFQDSLNTANINMNGPVIISDALPLTRAVSIFAGLTRDIASVASRFDDAGKNTTVLAPSNNAMMALPRKPWEDAEEYATMGTKAYEGQDGQERANENVKRFVQAHIVPKSPWGAGEKVRTLQGGAEIWWEAKEDGVKVIQPHGIEVIAVADKVANGEVWIVQKVLNYAS